MRFKDKCFMFKGKKDDIIANWSDARSWCKEQGGELAVIDDQYENGEQNSYDLKNRPVAQRGRLVTCRSSLSDFVSSHLRDLHLPTWIGLSDLLVEDQYGWSDGVSPVLYTNWNDKEPNNEGGAVRILHLHEIWSAKNPHAVLKKKNKKNNNVRSLESLLVSVTGKLCGHSSQPPGQWQVER